MWDVQGASRVAGAKITGEWHAVCGGLGASVAPLIYGHRQDRETQRDCHETRRIIKNRQGNHENGFELASWPLGCHEILPRSALTMKLTQCLVALWAATGLSVAVENSPAKRAGRDDLSIAIIESTLERFTPATIGGWEYFVSLYLMGQYVVYQRTGEQRYMTYIQEWADRWFDEDDQLTIDVDSLDDIQAGNVMLIVYWETGDRKYARAAKHLRDSLTKYPRTSDGAFWHALYWQNQIWADGTFMVNPFLQRYGHILGEKKYVDDETTEQLLAYGDHLRAKNELLYHAWDESHKATWANARTGLAGTQWCRAMGEISSFCASSRA